MCKAFLVTGCHDDDGLVTTAVQCHIICTRLAITAGRVAVTGQFLLILEQVLG